MSKKLLDQRERRRFEWWLRGLGLATIAHVSLPDYHQSGWLIPALVGWLGGLFLIGLSSVKRHPYTPDRSWIAILVLGTLILSKVYTLCVLRDVLTQSFLLVTYYLLALWGIMKRESMHSMLRHASACAALTYLLAAVHKYNFDFLFTQQSCALHGLDLVVNIMPSPLDAPLLAVRKVGREVPLVVATVVLCWEVALAALCLRGSRVLLIVGGLFHIPLTLTIAPAFGTVMAVGWGAGFLSTPMMTRTKVHILKRKQRGRGRRRPIRIACIPLLYALHGLSPYLGVEMQHSAAMLSNLRIDPPCANSLIFPVLTDDPYIYIDDVQFGQVQRVKRTKIVRNTLWNLTALHTMKQNWCIPEQRPLRLTGSFRKQSFTIDDLCTDNSLDALTVGSMAPKGWQRFQKNLIKTCHTACIH